MHLSRGNCITLTIIDNRFGERTFKLISHIMKSNYTLKKLTIDFQGNTCSGTTKDIADGIIVNTSITDLKFTGLNLDYQKIKYLLVALKTNTTITHINFPVSRYERVENQILQIVQLIKKRKPKDYKL